MAKLAELFAATANAKDGPLWIEEWPEGIVVFVGAKIVWRSWLDG